MAAFPSTDRPVSEAVLIDLGASQHLADALEGSVHASVSEISRDEWNVLYPSAPHSWDFYRAAERMPARSFSFPAIAIRSGGRLTAAAPLFRLAYRVDAPLGDGLRKAGDWIERRASSMVVMPVLGLGSPLTDECEIGFAPSLDREGRAAAFAAIIDTLTRHAAKTGVRVLVLKDVRDRDRPWSDHVLTGAGFSRVPSLPTATLELPFDSLDGYLQSLSPKMRSDLRRKQRQASGIWSEVRDSITGVEDEIEHLYWQTHEHRKASYELFDEVPRGYFRELMRGLDGRAKVLLLHSGDRLVGFNLFIVERDRIVGKHMGLRYPDARTLNAYFINWLEMVRWCIARRIPAMQVGQSSYVLKARLGCTLERSWIYARHTGAFRGPLFRLLAPLAAFDRFDPDLRALGTDAPYAPRM